MHKNLILFYGKDSAQKLQVSKPILLCRLKSLYPYKSLEFQTFKYCGKTERIVYVFQKDDHQL